MLPRNRTWVWEFHKCFIILLILQLNHGLKRYSADIHASQQEFRELEKMQNSSRAVLNMDVFILKRTMCIRLVSDIVPFSIDTFILLMRGNKQMLARRVFFHYFAIEYRVFWILWVKFKIRVVCVEICPILYRKTNWAKTEKNLLAEVFRFFTASWCFGYG